MIPRALQAQEQNLPFFGGEKWYCTQGNHNDPFFDNMSDEEKKNSDWTHQRLSMNYAFDFAPSGIRCTGLPVVSPVDGVVAYVYDDGIESYNQGWGLTVILKNENGCYKLHHFSKVFVFEGQQIKASEALGLCGHTGNVRSGNGGDGSHIHFQKDSECELNSVSVESHFDEVGQFPYDENADEFTKIGIPTKRNNLYLSGNWHLMDQKYHQKGASEKLGHLVSDPADGSNFSGIYPYFPWSNGTSNNVYIRRFTGGTMGEVAIIYDALGGAHEAYLIGLGFLHDQNFGWKTNQGPRSIVANPTSDEFIFFNLSKYPLTSRQNFQFAYATWSTQTGFRLHDWSGNLITYAQERPSVPIPGGFPDSNDADKAPDWDPKFSYHFVDAYNRNRKILKWYHPTNDVHFYGESKYLVQDYYLNEGDPVPGNVRVIPAAWLIFNTAKDLPQSYAQLSIPKIPWSLFFNPQTDFDARRAHVIRNFLSYFRSYPDHLNAFGMPLSDEISFFYSGIKHIVQFFEHIILVQVFKKDSTPIFAYDYSLLELNGPNLFVLGTEAHGNGEAERSDDESAPPVESISSESEENHFKDSNLIACASCPIGGAGFNESTTIPENSSVSLPDYIVKELTVGGLSQNINYQAGNPSLKIEFSIANQTSGFTSIESNTIIFLSKDSHFSEDDYLIDNLNLYPLLGFEKRSYSAYFDLPATFKEGDYFLVIEADAESVVNENSETNNRLSTVIIVTPKVFQRDLDQDGFYAREQGGEDCNDTDPLVFPGAYDFGNDGIDQNCDGADSQHLAHTYILKSPTDGTIQAYINRMENGDTLIVGDGRYPVDHLNFWGKRIKVLSANGPYRTILDGSASADSCVIFMYDETYDSVLAGFTVENCPDNGVEIIGNSHPFIYNMIVRNCLKNGFFVHNSWSGLHPLIQTSLIYRNQQAGLFAAKSSFSLLGSTVVANSMEGVYVYDYTEGYIYHNIIAFNGKEGVWFDPSYGNYLNVIRNDFFNNGRVENLSNFTGGETNSRNDPLFIDPQNHNYHLRAESPMIDGAISDYTMPVPIDGDGDPRWIGPRLDIGFDEFNPFTQTKVWCQSFNTLDQNTYFIPQWSTTLLQEVIDKCLSHGDTLLLDRGTYYIDNLHFRGKKISVISIHGPNETILDGSTGNGNCLTFEHGERDMILEGVTVQNCKEVGIWIQSGSPHLKRLVVRWARRVGIFSTEDYNGGKIENTIVYQNGESGIVLYYSSTRVTHVTSVENGFNGIACMGNSSLCEITNSIFAFNKRNGIYFDHTGKIIPRAVNLFSNEGGDSEVIYDQNQIIYHFNPLFSDQSHGNYRLSLFSPLINKGASHDNAPLVDFEGENRSFGGNPDIGFDEFNPSFLEN